MAIRTKRFPECDLSLCIVSGAHTCEEAVGYFEGLGAADATRWLHCFDPTLDMSGHDVACLPRLKRTIIAKRRELFGDKPKLYAIVCPSNASEAFFKFWCGFVEAGEHHGTAPQLFPSLEAACEAFGLPEAARRAVMKAAKERPGERTTEQPVGAPAGTPPATHAQAPKSPEHSRR
jgi:hypothetical protein